MITSRKIFSLPLNFSLAKAYPAREHNASVSITATMAIKKLLKIYLLKSLMAKIFSYCIRVSSSREIEMSWTFIVDLNDIKNI